MMDQLSEMPKTQNELMSRMSALGAARDMAARRLRDARIHGIKLAVDVGVVAGSGSALLDSVPRILEMAGTDPNLLGTPEGLLRLGVVAVGTLAGLTAVKSAIRHSDAHEMAGSEASLYRQYADMLEPAVLTGVGDALRLTTAEQPVTE
ncbi:hypothetical protein A3D06_02270 [Candidatus Roizmanbacteria bacterium RIFCSPHIGHO2_02_FULL_40_9]|uniref:Uncharacterized protein n=1 Tax=Candidatus Roizmanbacteria bacterium RIFCSPHIGHO2_02_FULL_40_9 TaxID=1802042 RepID=A0A1F7HC75_9BACT|nr:MAG: hypothetical protein A3D06_02270 [Candidatus Roizmanbacteria bacterium RIFCSPHIGHO2_02_FULL_40_9]